jgi:hypothetical protein
MSYSQSSGVLSAFLYFILDMGTSSSTPPKRLIARCPRRNLPISVGRKRGESNFVLAFSRAYERDVLSKRAGRSHQSNRELPVTGFGIADFVCVAWKSPNERGGGNMVAASRRPPEPRYEVSAFEMKLSHWARGFAQAARYRFFAHRAFLVLPPAEAKLARQKLDLFRVSGVGLISYDLKRDRITRIHTPRIGKPRSVRAYDLALSRLGIQSVA